MALRFHTKMVGVVSCAEGWRRKKLSQSLKDGRAVTTVKVTEVCLFIIFFLTVWVWHLTIRIKELELHKTALWEECERLCKRIEDLEKDGEQHEG